MVPLVPWSPGPRHVRSAVHRGHLTPALQRRPSDAVSPPVPGPSKTLTRRPCALAARGHLPRCPARRRGHRGPQRLLCAGQPQQRQGPGRLQHGDRRRRPHHPVDQERSETAAVAVRRFRGRLLPHQVQPLGQGAGCPQLVHRERRLDRPVGRPERHQPAVAAGRQLGRLRAASLAPQQQGSGSTRRLHRRQREHRPVRRLGRRQPAVAARQGRRRQPRHVRSAVDIPLDIYGRWRSPRPGGPRSRTSPSPPTTASISSMRRRTAPREREWAGVR